MAQAAVALGGNLGDVPATIEAACAELERHAAISDLRCSSLFRSAPMGAVAGETFWNAACVLETSLDPHALLAELQRVENLSGRTRDVRWGPRTLDLDLILYGDEVVHSERLTVPHPHFWYRGFVLEPLAELIPDTVPPGFALSIRELAERLRARPFRLGLGGEFDAETARQVVADAASIRCREATGGNEAGSLDHGGGNEAGSLDHGGGNEAGSLDHGGGNEAGSLDHGGGNEAGSLDYGVELVEFEGVSPRDVQQLSLAVWFGEAPEWPRDLDASLVLCCERFETQVLRDVLAAAGGRLERVA